MKNLLIGAALATLALTSAANATITVSLSSAKVPTSFDNNALGSTSGVTGFSGLSTTFSTTGSSKVTSGTTAGLVIAPSGDSSHYFYATTGSNAVLDFGKSVKSITFLWGSIDTFNKITFSNGDTLTGTEVLAALSIPVAESGKVSKWLTITDTNAFSGFTASTTGKSFEFDAAGAVPEPSTWALLLAGFGSLGFAGYRSKRKGAVNA